jgi:hypothetical protein
LGVKAKNYRGNRVISLMSFYDDLAPFYHLIYPDWEGSIDRQGRQLAALMEDKSRPDNWFLGL